MTNIPIYLKKIESQLQAFAMTENIENLQKARELIEDLESKLQHEANHKCAHDFANKLQNAFKSSLQE